MSDGEVWYDHETGEKVWPDGTRRYEPNWALGTRPNFDVVKTYRDFVHGYVDFDEVTAKVSALTDEQKAERREAARRVFGRTTYLPDDITEPGPDGNIDLSRIRRAIEDGGD